MDNGHFQDSRSDRVSTPRVDIAPTPDTPTATDTLRAIPRAVVVGSLSEAVHRVNLPDSVVWTRERALRLSVWTFAWHAVAAASGAGFSPLVGSVASHLLDLQ